MNHYVNSAGLDISNAKPKKFDPTALVSLGLDLIVGTVAGISNAKKQRELEEKIAKLSLKQQKELELALSEAQNETMRVSIMYQTFAVLQNQKLVDEQKTKRFILLGILGGGVLLLVGLAIVYKRR
tara:strand:+ start:5337 stop:5714 length:378 start_codon:yes stop_codon:yes gene_type:complete